MHNIIIEVGANSGQDSIRYSNIKNSFLYAFEPVPYLGDALKKLLDDNEITNYKLIRSAVSDTNGKAVFNISGPDESHNFACSSLNQFSDDIHQTWGGRSDFAHIDSLEVDTIRLDTFIEQEGIKEIEYLHIDAQGSDFNVLKSLGDKASIVKAGKCEAANKVALYKDVDNSVYSIMEWLDKNGFKITKLNNHHGQPITINDLPNSTEEVDVNFERI
jgi:FkbM family methyltransferase